MITGLSSQLPYTSQINANSHTSSESGQLNNETDVPSPQAEDAFTHGASESQSMQNAQALRQLANHRPADASQTPPAPSPQTADLNAAPAPASSSEAAPAPAPESAPAPAPEAAPAPEGAPAPAGGGQINTEGAPAPASVPLDLSAPNIVDVVSSSAAELGAKAALGAIGGAAAYGAVSVFITAAGAKELAEGIREHDKNSIMSGTGNLTGGISSGLSTAAEAVTALNGASAFTQVAGAIAAPLGIASGAIDIVSGTQKTVSGIKNHDKNKIITGLLNVGYGTAMTAAVCVGGLPALAVAGVLLAAKAGFSIYANHAAHRQQQSNPPEPPAPPAQDSSPAPAADASDSPAASPDSAPQPSGSSPETAPSAGPADSSGSSQGQTDSPESSEQAPN